jgi:hypothetical protein
MPGSFWLADSSSPSHGKKSLEERVSALEVQMGGKTLEEHFREQSQLIDRLLAYRFDEFEKKWDARLDENSRRGSRKSLKRSSRLAGGKACPNPKRPGQRQKGR